MRCPVGCLMYFWINPEGILGNRSVLMVCEKVLALLHNDDDDDDALLTGNLNVLQ